MCTVHRTIQSEHDFAKVGGSILHVSKLMHVCRQIIGNHYLNEIILLRDEIYMNVKRNLITLAYNQTKKQKQ